MLNVVTLRVVVMLNVVILKGIMLNVVMLSVVILSHYAACRYAECRSTGCLYAECRGWRSTITQAPRLLVCPPEECSTAETGHATVVNLVRLVTDLATDRTDVAMTVLLVGHD